MSPIPGCSTSSASAQDAAAPAGETEQLLEELRQVYRTLYALSSDEERSQILGRLFSHGLAPMRAFGLDLARRTLLNARSVPADLLARASALLADDAPAVRRNAAQLIATMGGEAASRTLVDALAIEDDASVASEILRALSQNPGLVSMDDLYRWMGTRGEASDAAFAVALAISRGAERELSEAQRDRVRSLIGEFDAARSSPARVSLAWRLGMEAYVSSALASGSNELRSAAAAALIRDETLAGRVIDSAMVDAALFPFAVDGIVAHRATAEGYRTAQLLAAGSDEIRRGGLRKVLLALGPRDLVAIARSESDLFVRETMLEHLEDESFAVRLTEDAPWAIALRELVHTRAKIRDCAGVASASILLETVRGGTPDDETAEARVVCLIDLGRLDQAEAVTAALLGDGEASMGRLADAWIEGITRIQGDPARVGAGIAVVERLFGEALTPAQRGLLEGFVRPAPESGVGSGVPGGTIPPQ